LAVKLKKSAIYDDAKYTFPSKYFWVESYAISAPYIDYIYFSTDRIMQADSRPFQIKNISTELDLYLLQLDSQALLDHPFLVRVRKQLERYDVQLT
jgi:hypothetical protein